MCDKSGEGCCGTGGCGPAGGGSGQAGGKTEAVAVVIGAGLGQALRNMAKASGGTSGKIGRSLDEAGQASGEGAGKPGEAGPLTQGERATLAQLLIRLAEAEGLGPTQLGAGLDWMVELVRRAAGNPGPTRTDMSDKGDRFDRIRDHQKAKAEAKAGHPHVGESFGVAGTGVGFHRRAAARAAGVPAESELERHLREQGIPFARKANVEVERGPVLHDRKAEEELTEAIAGEKETPTQPYIRVEATGKIEIGGFRQLTSWEERHARQYIDAGVNQAAAYIRQVVAPVEPLRAYTKDQAAAELIAIPYVISIEDLEKAAVNGVDVLGELNRQAQRQVDEEVGRQLARDLAQPEQVVAALHSAEAAIGERLQAKGSPNPAGDAVRARNFSRSAFELDTDARRLFKPQPGADDYRVAGEAIHELRRRAQMVETAQGMEAAGEPGGVTTRVNRIADALAAIRSAAAELARGETEPLGKDRKAKWSESQSWCCVRDNLDAVVKEMRGLVNHARRLGISYVNERAVADRQSREMEALMLLAAGTNLKTEAVTSHAGQTIMVGLATERATAKRLRDDMEVLRQVAKDRTGTRGAGVRMKTSEAEVILNRIRMLQDEAKKARETKSYREDLHLTEQARRADREVVIEATGAREAVKKAFPCLLPGWDDAMDDRLWEVAVQRVIAGVKDRSDLVSKIEALKEGLKLSTEANAEARAKGEARCAENVMKTLYRYLSPSVEFTTETAVEHAARLRGEMEKATVALSEMEARVAKLEQATADLGGQADLRALLRVAAGHAVNEDEVKTQDGRALARLIGHLREDRGRAFEDGAKGLARSVSDAIIGGIVQAGDPQVADVVLAVRHLREDLEYVAALAAGQVTSGFPQTHAGRRAVEAIQGLWSAANSRGAHSARHQDDLALVIDLAEGRESEALHRIASGASGVGVGAIAAVHRLRTALGGQLSEAQQEIHRLKTTTVTEERLAAVVADAVRKATAPMGG